MPTTKANDIQNMMEAYAQIYAPKEEVDIDLLSQEIFEEVAVALISQGYTAVDVLEYFANVDDEIIIEDIVALSDGTLLLASVVSEEYIEEQLQQLDEIWGLVARGAMALARPAANLVAKQAPRIAQAATKLGQRASNVAWRATPASSKKLLMPAGAKSAAPTIVKPNILQQTRSAIGTATQRVKDVAKGALDKLPGGSKGRLASGLKTAGTWALGGAGFEAGMRAAKSLLGNETGTAKASPAGPPSLKAKQDYAKSKGKYYSSSDQKTYANYNDALAARNSRRGTPGVSPGKPPAAPSAPSGGGASSRSSGTTTSPAPKASTTPSSSSGKWTFNNKQVTDSEVNKQYSDLVKAGRTKEAEDLGRNIHSQKYGQLQKGPSTTPEQDKDLAQQAMKDVQAQQDRERKKLEQQQKAPQPQAVNASYEYDAFDLVLEYLTSEGHVESLDEALYVMMEMDSETIQSICEAASGQSDKQIEKGVKTTYKAGNVLDNQHQGRSKGLNKLPAGEREAKTKRMRGRLKTRRDDLFGERNKREDEKREKLKKLLGL